MDEFYRAMNTVRPSLRRIGADEVTYSLHVILRYELERDYFSGKIGTEDLNIAWSDKYKKYHSDKHRQKQKACSAALVITRAVFYIFRCQSCAMLNAVDTLMLCTVVHKCSFNILHL